MDPTGSDPTPDPSRETSADRAARESIQRALDQCLEEGQLHRLHQLATGLNKMHHGKGQED